MALFHHNEFMSDFKTSKSIRHRRKDVRQPQPNINFHNLYRPITSISGFNSLYLEDKIINQYLKCEIKCWTHPRHSTDKVDLEPLPSNFLPPQNNRPLLYPIYGESRKPIQYVRRICGYREIQKKRLYIEYLREKEKEELWTQLLPTKTVTDVDDDDLEFELNRRFRHIAPGGGKKEKKKESRKEQDGNDNRHKEKKKEKSAQESKVAEQLSNERRKVPERGETSGHNRHSKAKTSGGNKDRSKIKMSQNEQSEKQSGNQKVVEKVKTKVPKTNPVVSSKPENKKPKDKTNTSTNNHEKSGTSGVDKNKVKNNEKEKRDLWKKVQKAHENLKDKYTKLKHHKTLKVSQQQLPNAKEAKSENDDAKTKAEANETRTPEKVSIIKLNQLQYTQPNAEKSESQPNGPRHPPVNEWTGNDENNDKLVGEKVQRKSESSVVQVKGKSLGKLGETVQRKLATWIKSGNEHRLITPGVPDINANFLQETEESTNVINRPQRLSLHPDTAITIPERQTTEQIADYFQNTEQTVVVYAATVPKTPINKKPAQPTPVKKGPNPKEEDKRGPGTNVQKPGVLVKGKRKSEVPNKGKGPTGTTTKKPSDPKFDITNFESYYKFVYGTEMFELPERDSEWLELSSSNDEDGDDQKYLQSFEKPLQSWMFEGISFESQELVSELQPLYWICAIMGRQFYYTIPNFLKGHMEFATKRTKQIPFFFSAFILWSSLVLICQSYASIIMADDTDGRVKIEKLEMSKYAEACLFVMANLALAAVWSVQVILRDGQLITHYLNCWVPALAEMETSGTLDIAKLTWYNLLAWVISSTIMVICFSLDFPANVRGTSGLMAMLMFRGLVADIRLLDPGEFIVAQTIGLVFILYVLYCARMLFALMQVVSLIIRNTAEMWNFKFALTFQQLMLTNRGTTKRISLRLPLINFFTHHRLMTALLKIYGDIFGVPILTYMVVQIGVITYVLVHLFNFKAGDPNDYKGSDKVTYEFIDRHGGGGTAKLKVLDIPYYHAPVEEIPTSLFVLALVLFDFLLTTEVLSTATQSFFDGFEFVRRTNLILCKSSHQRRVIQSLLWSMSDTDPPVISACKYVAIRRPTVLAGLGTAIYFFSMIIQLQSERQFEIISFTPCGNQSDQNKEDRCKVK